jgi:hypothetical protein
MQILESSETATASIIMLYLHEDLDEFNIIFILHNLNLY